MTMTNMIHFMPDEANRIIGNMFWEGPQKDPREVSQHGGPNERDHTSLHYFYGVPDVSKHLLEVAFLPDRCGLPDVWTGCGTDAGAEPVESGAL
jgi:hypothetical protein